MNVLVSNLNKDKFSSLGVDIIKSITGEFDVDEIVQSFSNFFFNRMFLDITAIKDYKNFANIQKLSLGLDVDKIIILLNDDPVVNSNIYLAKLVSMGIYNFAKNMEEVMYLYNNPNSYRDVAQYHQLDTTHDSAPTIITTQVIGGSSTIVLGIKNVTEGAGATTLTYIMKKQLERNYNVTALELDKHDFMYFGDKNMYSINAMELGNNLSKFSSSDVILVDMNNSPAAEGVIKDVLYLVEPSKIKLNKLLARNPRAFDKYKGKKIILNKSLLSSHDVLDFEYETNSKTFYNLPPLYDQENKNATLDALLSKMGFVNQISQNGEVTSNQGQKKGLFGMFK